MATRIKLCGALVLIIMLSLAPGKASACIAQELRRTPFFEKADLPSGDVAPIVADVIVVWKSSLPDGRVVLIARVNKTLRGQIDGWNISITTFRSSCDLVPTIGARGLVAGRMIPGEHGALEFQAVIESFGERSRRRAAAARMCGTVIDQSQCGAEGEPRLLAQSESRPNSQQAASAQPEMQYLGAFLDRPPTKEERETLPSSARDVLAAKVRFRGRILYLVGRHQSGAPPKDLFMATVEVVEALEGQATVGAKYELYFGVPDLAKTYIYPHTEAQRSRDYFIVSFAGSDNRRRLLELPRKQQEYDTWLKEVAR